MEHFDFKVVIEHTNGRQESAKVTASGYVVEYANQAGRRGSKLRLSSMAEDLIPDPRIQEEVPWPSNMATSTAITEYQGEQLEVVREPDHLDRTDLLAVEVDRISNSGNPVVQVGSGHMILDQGEEGERYLVEKIGDNRGRVVSRFKSDADGGY
jgi:hypothetical protein